MGAGVELDETGLGPEEIFHVYEWLDGIVESCMLGICC